MNRNYLRLFALAMLLAAGHVDADVVFAPLNLTNVAKLNAIAFTSSPITSNATNVGSFLAVGAGNEALIWSFTNISASSGTVVPTETNNWTVSANSLLTSASTTNLSVAAGATGYFVSGQNNRVYSLPFGGGSWSPVGTNAAFNNGAYGSGLAYNHGNGVLVEVGEAPEISWINGSNLAGLGNSPWIGATASGGFDVADSFRAIIPYTFADQTTANFAACGVLGTVYISTNGGDNWIHVNGHVTDSTFYGIASDNVKTIVCVGAGGSITTLTDTGGGNVAVTTNVTELQKDTLLSVAYLGQSVGFIAVGISSDGSSGVELISTNGINWGNRTNIPNFLPTAITYASSGYFEGVGAIVGSGTGTNVFLFATNVPPSPVTVTPTSQTNFVGQVSAPVVVSVTNGYPVGTETVDWFGPDMSPIAANTVLSNGFSYFYPPVVTVNVTSNYVYTVRARDLRTGFVSATATVTNSVYAEPTAFIYGIESAYGTNTIYNGQTNLVYATLTGTPPFNVTWQESWTNGTGTSVTNTLVTIGYSGDALITNGGNSYTIVLTNYPAATNGLPLLLTNTPTTANNFTVTNYWPNSAAGYTITITNLTDLICQTPVYTNLPGLLSPLQGVADITVNPRPTASVIVSGSTTIVNGSSVTVQANITGLGVWIVQWSSNGIPVYTNTAVAGVPDVITQFPSNPNLNMISASLYTVTYLTDTNGFPAITNELTGGALITVDPVPTAALVGSTTITNGGSLVIIVTNTGVGPWTNVWADGYVFTNNTLTGDGPLVYTRTVSPTNANADLVLTNIYSLVSLTETNGYPAFNLGTPVVVTVEPNPAAFVSGSTTISNGGSATVQALVSGFGPFSLTWSSNGVPIVTNTVATGGTTNFLVVNPTAVDPNTNGVSVYTVSSLIESNGFAALGSALTGSAIVTVVPDPTATVYGSTTISNGDLAIITVTNTGVGPWTNIWNDGETNIVSGVGPVVFTRTVDPTNGSANVVSTNIYSLVSLMETNGYSTTNLGASVLITVVPNPTATLLGSTTISNGGFAIITVTNTGVGPWTNVWNDGVTNIVDGVGPVVFTRTVSPTNGTANNLTTNLYGLVELLETNGYSTTNLGAAALVTVVPDPTAVVSGTTIITNGGAALVTVTLTGVGPWTNYWSDLTQPIITNSLTGKGPLTYYRTVAPGDANPNSFSQSTYSLGLLEETNGYSTNNSANAVVVTVDPNPTAFVSGSTTISNGGFTTVQALVSGFGPLLVTWSSNGVPIVTNTVVTGGTTNILSVSPASTSLNSNGVSIYTVTSLQDGNGFYALGSALSGSAMVTVVPDPTVTIQGSTTISNGGFAIITVTNTGVGPWTNIWNDGMTNIVSGVGPVSFTRTVSPTNASANAVGTNMYALVSLTETNGYSTNYLGTPVLITVVPDPTAVISGTTIITNGGTALITVNLTGVGPWTNHWSDLAQPIVTNSPSGNGPFTYYRTVSPIAESISESVPTIYSLGLLEGTNGYSTNNSANTVVIQVDPNPTAIVTGSTTISNGDTAGVQAYVTGAGPLIVTWASNGVALVTQTGVAGGTTTTLLVSPTSASLNSSSVSIYTVSSLQDVNGFYALGSALNTGAVITVVPNPAAVVIGGTNICSEGNAIITVTNIGVGPWTNIWSDGVTNVVLGVGPQVFTRTVSPTNTSTGLATNTYSLLSLTETNGYSTTNLGPTVSVTVYPDLTNAPAVDGTNLVFTCYYSPVTLSVSVPAGFTADWYDTNEVNVASGVTNFVPPVPSTFGTNSSVTNIYYVASRFGGSTACDSPVATNTVVWQLCNNLNIVSTSPTNFSLEWYGTNTLQSTTNLAMPVWVTVTNGTAGGFNLFSTNSVQNPPILFYRIY